VPQELKGKTLTTKLTYSAGPFSVELKEKTFTTK
jgi:hypothetical protein